MYCIKYTPTTAFAYHATKVNELRNLAQAREGTPLLKRFSSLCVFSGDFSNLVFLPLNYQALSQLKLLLNH